MPDEQARLTAAKAAAMRRAEAQEETLIDRVCEVWATPLRTAPRSGERGNSVERLVGRGETPAEAWEKAAASYRRGR